MAKEVALENRIKTGIISFVTLPQRREVEKLARKEQVSLSEIGRRALAAYIEQKRA